MSFDLPATAVSPKPLQQIGAESGKTILLADDDAETREMLSYVLRAAGYPVVTCIDGQDLLAHLRIARGRFGRNRLGLIITDQRMPGLAGLDAIMKLRGEISLPPTILITGFGDGRLIESAFAAGCVAVFDKPFDPGVLVLRAAEILGPPPPARTDSGL